jgi:hypothetical protein
VGSQTRKYTKKTNYRQGKKATAEVKKNKGMRRKHGTFYGNTAYANQIRGIVTNDYLGTTYNRFGEPDDSAYMPMADENDGYPNTNLFVIEQPAQLPSLVKVTGNFSTLQAFVEEFYRKNPSLRQFVEIFGGASPAGHLQLSAGNTQYFNEQMQTTQPIYLYGSRYHAIRDGYLSYYEPPETTRPLNTNEMRQMYVPRQAEWRQIASVAGVNIGSVNSYNQQIAATAQSGYGMVENIPKFYTINAQEQVAMVERNTLVAWKRIEKFVRDVEEGRIRAGGIEKVPIGTIDARDSVGVVQPAYRLTNAVIWVSKQNLNSQGIRWVAGYNGLTTQAMYVPLLAAYDVGDLQYYDNFNQNYTPFEFMAGIARALTTLERPGSDFASTNLEIDANTGDFSKALAEALAKEKQNALDIAAANTQQNDWRQDINVTDNNVDKILLQEQQKQNVIDAQYRLDDMQQRYQEQVFQQQQESLERIRQANEAKLMQQTKPQADLLARQQAEFERKQQDLLTAQSNQWLQSANNQAFNQGTQEFSSSYTDSQKDYNNNFGVQVQPTNLINTNFAPKPPANTGTNTNTGTSIPPKSGTLKTADNPNGENPDNKKGLSLWAKIAIGVGAAVVLVSGGVVTYKVLSKPKKADKTGKADKKDKPKGSNKKDLKQKPKKGNK